MSVRCIARVLHHSRARGTDKLVLVALANYANDEGTAWPTVSTLAAHANVTARAVQGSLARLVGSGELLVHRQAGGAPDLPADQRPNLYRLCIECPAGCDGTTNHRVSPLPRSAAALVDKGGEAECTG